MACGTPCYFFQTVSCCALVALLPIPPSPNGSFPFPWVRGHLLSSSALSCSPAGLCEWPRDFVPCLAPAGWFCWLTHPICAKYLRAIALPLPPLQMHYGSAVSHDLTFSALSYSFFPARVMAVTWPHVPLTQRGLCDCITHQEPIYQKSLLLWWVRHVQETPSFSSLFFCSELCHSQKQ